MKALFNGVCDECKQLRPRCADVHQRVGGKATRYHDALLTLCEACRQLPRWRGKFRLDARHK